MKCPACKLELRITNSYTVSEDKTAVTVQEFGCVNAQCPNSRARLPVKLLKTEHPRATRKQRAVRACAECGTVLVRIGDRDYETAAGAEHDVSTGGMMNIRCPGCGAWQAFDVSGRKAAG